MMLLRHHPHVAFFFRKPKIRFIFFIFSSFFIFFCNLFYLFYWTNNWGKKDVIKEKRKKPKKKAVCVDDALKLQFIIFINVVFIIFVKFIFIFINLVFIIFVKFIFQLHRRRTPLKRVPSFGWKINCYSRLVFRPKAGIQSLCWRELF